MYDLIVIGAGPAGASAARSAAKRGLKTLLLEKDRIPRDKLCGGGITPKVLKLLDFTLPDELIECKTYGTRLHIGDNDYDFKSSNPLAYMTSRSKLDTFLTEKAVEAGAELRDQCPVQRIEQTTSGVEVKTRDGSFYSRLLVGADGMGGPTAKAAGFYQRWKPDDVAYAIESEIFVGESAVQDFVGDAGYFDLYFGVSPAGYGWVFPKDDHLTVGVGCRLNKLRDAQELFQGFAKRVSAVDRTEIPKPKAHLIPLGGAAKVPSVKNRVMLAGDCAGFAEPLLGEGIHFSIWGGQIAGQVAAEACQEEKYGAEFLGRYEQHCREAFGIDFDVAYKIACASYLEEYDMDRVARFFFGDRKVQDCLVGLMDGRLRYRDAQKLLAWRYFKYRVAKLGLPFYS